MVRVLALLAAVSACGRIAFDAPPPPDASAMQPQDARSCATPSGHDEDGDGVDDSCDVCPHLADDQSDGDGDRVGDACDPEPGVPRQSIALFDPFIDQRPGWEFADASTDFVDASGLHLFDAGGYNEYRRPYSEGVDVFIVHAAMPNAGTGPYHFQIELYGSAPYFYCEVYTDPSFHTLSFTWTTDGTNYQSAIVPAAQPFVGGNGDLSLAVNPSTVTCASNWFSEPLTVTGAHPAVTPLELKLSSNNADVVVDYLVQIRTQ